MCALAHGINFFYFNEDMVNLKAKTIKGWFWNVDKCRYVQKETPYPDIVDFTRRSELEKTQLISELRKHCIFTWHHLGGKSTIYSVLENAGFLDYLVESHEFNDCSIDDIYTLLQKHKTLIIKPTDSSLGRGVRKLRYENERYYLHYRHEETEYNRVEFQKYLDDKLRTKKFLIQEYIQSVSNSGSPFDLRVNVRRSKGGKWSSIEMFTRNGHPDGVISNLAAGGYSVAHGLEYFLRFEFGDDEAKRIHDEAMTIARTLPAKFQEGYSTPFVHLGIDLVINRTKNNEIKILELNSNPIACTIEHIAAEDKVWCYKWLASGAEEPE